MVCLPTHVFPHETKRTMKQLTPIISVLRLETIRQILPHLRPNGTIHLGFGTWCPFGPLSAILDFGHEAINESFEKLRLKTPHTDKSTVLACIHPVEWRSTC